MAHETLHRDETVQLSSNPVFIFVAVFLIVDAFPLLTTSGGVLLWSLIGAAVFLAAAVIMPGVLEPGNRLWMRFGMLLHEILSPLVPCIVFFGVIKSKQMTEAQRALFGIEKLNVPRSNIPAVMHVDFSARV